MFSKPFPILFLLLLCVAGPAFGQNGSLRGRILSTQGEALVGVNVFLKNEPTRGSVSDAQGDYRLANLPEGRQRIVFSYIGLQEERELLIGPDTRFDLRVDTELRLDEIIVDATRADEAAPVTRSNLSGKALRSRALGQDMPFLLRFTPSTVVTSDAGTGIGYTGIRIRGSDPTRTNITVNGVPLNDAESQGVFWVNMPDFASSVDQVQIQRGVGASTNGTGAFGATINLQTTALRPDAYAEWQGGAGSFGTWRQSLMLGTGLIDEHFSVDARLSRIQSDGYIDRATADLRSWYVSGAYVDGKTSLRLIAFSGQEVTYQAWYGVPRSLLDSQRTFNPAGTEKDGDPYDREVDDYGQTHYQALLSHQFGPQWNANVALHYTRGAGFFEQYKADEFLPDYGIAPAIVGQDSILESDLIRRRWLDNHFYGLTYSLNYEGGPWQITLGGAASQYRGRHFGEVIWARWAGNSEIRHIYYDNDAVKTEANVFARANYQLSKTLSLWADWQYRTVRYEFLGFDNAGRNVTQDDVLHFFNPKIGLRYATPQGNEWYAFAGIANREPNRDDYTESSPSSRPRPERLYNLELGYRRQRAAHTLGANLYGMYYRDQLAVTGRINDVGAYTRQNIPDSYRYGLELEAGWQMADAWRLEGSATLSQNKVRRFTEFIDDFDTGGQRSVLHERSDLAFSPDAIGMLVLGYEALRHLPAHDLSLNLLNKYVGRQFIDNTSNEAAMLEAYFFSDLQIAYTWRPSRWLQAVEAKILLNNVWDALYENNAYTYRYYAGGELLYDQGFYPQAGRHVLFGLNLRF